MNPQHTPGPWAAMDGPAVEAFGHVLVAAGPASTVAHVPLRRTNNSRSAHADARLIAAAPNMLEALKLLVVAADIHDPGHIRLTTNYCSLPSAIREARAAIAKAEGR